MKAKQVRLILVTCFLFMSLGIFAQDNAVPDWDHLPVRKTSSGMLVAGKGPQTRVFSPFGTAMTLTRTYAQIANTYHDSFGDAVHIWLMPIPLASAFYTPQGGEQWTRDQHEYILDMFAQLQPGATGVDLIDTLRAHRDEPLYSRSDHHWAPLGAYYAAREFARVAGVPFRDLSSYDTHVVHGFVGTMASWGKDAAAAADLRKYPEDFVYYTPRDVEYTTTYINYRGKYNAITGASQPTQGAFFREYADGSSAAYCTFMGGDMKLTKVQTSTHNGRRLAILKDSFGNAIPGYLFYSFEEIHVIDCRAFTKNLKAYVRDNAITDILFANNLSHVAMKATHTAYGRYLVQ